MSTSFRNRRLSLRKNCISFFVYFLYCLKTGSHFLTFQHYFYFLFTDIYVHSCGITSIVWLCSFGYIIAKLSPVLSFHFNGFIKNCVYSANVSEVKIKFDSYLDALHLKDVFVPSCNILLTMLCLAFCSVLFFEK